MEKSRRNENMRGEKSRERIEATRNMGKKKRREETESNRRKKMFCLWRFWAYCPITK